MRCGGAGGWCAQLSNPSLAKSAKDGASRLREDQKGWATRPKANLGEVTAARHLPALEPCNKRLPVRRLLKSATVNALLREC